MRRTLDIFSLNSLGCCELLTKSSHEADPRSRGSSNTNARTFLRRSGSAQMLDAVAKSSSFRVLAPSRRGVAVLSVGGPAHGRLVSRPHYSGQRWQSRRRPVGKREHCGFVGFERDLLSEHHIASRQSTIGNETPADRGLPGCVELYNIAQGTILNSISPAGVRTGDFEIVVGIELRALLWRYQSRSRRRERASGPFCSVTLR
ncbi:hypothetical protein ABIB68_005125 [Bradyrhizobium sp. F1.2.2]